MASLKVENLAQTTSGLSPVRICTPRLRLNENLKSHAADASSCIDRELKIKNRIAIKMKCLKKSQ